MNDVSIRRRYHDIAVRARHSDAVDCRCCLSSAVTVADQRDALLGCFVVQHGDVTVAVILVVELVVVTVDTVCGIVMYLADAVACAARGMVVMEYSNSQSLRRSAGI